jgi:hypothetical protein
VTHPVSIAPHTMMIPKILNLMSFPLSDVTALRQTAPECLSRDIYRQVHALCRHAAQEKHNHHINKQLAFTSARGLISKQGLSIEAFRDNLFPADWGLMQQPVGTFSRSGRQSGPYSLGTRDDIHPSVRRPRCGAIRRKVTSYLMSLDWRRLSWVTIAIGCSPPHRSGSTEQM